jgi:hypothetical protein
VFGNLQHRWLLAEVIASRDAGCIDVGLGPAATLNWVSFNTLPRHHATRHSRIEGPTQTRDSGCTTYHPICAGTGWATQNSLEQ